MMHVQFSSHNLLSKALNGLMSILMNELLRSGYSVRCCGADGPTCVLVILNGYPTGPEPRMHLNNCAWSKLSSPNTCLIISRLSVTLFPRFAQNLMHTHCYFIGSIMKSHKARYRTPNKRKQKISTSTQLHEMLYIDFQGRLLLSSIVASRYYNYSTDGSTSP
jgi:hypothetical protein